jgi:hypothetical protein
MPEERSQEEIAALVCTGLDSICEGDTPLERKDFKKDSHNLLQQLVREDPELLEEVLEFINGYAEDKSRDEVKKWPAWTHKMILLWAERKGVEFEIDKGGGKGKGDRDGDGDGKGKGKGKGVGKGKGKKGGGKFGDFGGFGGDEGGFGGESSWR